MACLVHQAVMMPHWSAFSVEVLAPFHRKKRFCHWKVLHRIPFPKLGSYFRQGLVLKRKIELRAQPLRASECGDPHLGALNVTTNLCGNLQSHFNPSDPHNPLTTSRVWPDFDLKSTQFWPLGAILNFGVKARPWFRSNRGKPDRGEWGRGHTGWNGSVAPS